MVIRRTTGHRLIKEATDQIKQSLLADGVAIVITAWPDEDGGQAWRMKSNMDDEETERFLRYLLDDVLGSDKPVGNA
jgi:hypothetical protein